MAGKLPDCLENYSLNSELEPVTRLQDCYKELTAGFRIRDNLSPTLELSRISPGPLPFDASALLDKDFQIFLYSNEQLISCAVEMFSQFHLDRVKLVSFLDLVNRNYFTYVPYHNFKHGFSVLQLIYVIAERNQKLFSFISNQDYLFLLLAGIGHDLCHPGINNGYLIGTKHEIALRYNNVSVLENHHAASTLELLNSSALIEDCDQNYMREVVTYTILCTDMTKHKDVCANFEKLKSKFDKSSKADRLALMGYLLHCADLGNPTLDFPLATIWSFKILQEFNNQVAYEEKSRVTVSEFMRIGNDLEKIKKSQIGLIDYIVLPLWSGLAEVVENIEDLPETIKKNKQVWIELTDFSFVFK